MFDSLSAGTQIYRSCLRFQMLKARCLCQILANWLLGIRAALICSVCHFLWCKYSSGQFQVTDLKNILIFNNWLSRNSRSWHQHTIDLEAHGMGCWMGPHGEQCLSVLSSTEKWLIHPPIHPRFWLLSCPRWTSGVILTNSALYITLSDLSHSQV